VNTTELLTALVLASGLGFWAYRDAKSLQGRGIQVRWMPPAGWGWAVMLFALLFGPLYLLQRFLALGRGPVEPEVEPPPFEEIAPPEEPIRRRRFCGRCGEELQADASACPQCGHPVSNRDGDGSP
jgi:hypothetical protein